MLEGLHEHAPRLRILNLIVMEPPKEICKGIFFSFIVGEQGHCLKPVEFDFLRGRGSWLKVVLGVTGASGVYGVSLLSELAKAGTELAIIVSAAKRVLAAETRDVIGKVLDVLGVEWDLSKRWAG